MCTIIARKFPNIGWIGVKNRDRSESTRTKLVRDINGSVERVSLIDEQTQWSEGMNSDGVGIISSSLTPTVNGIHPEHSSRDGECIHMALKTSTVYEALTVLRLHHVAGCVMVFDTDQLWLIEGKSGGREQIIKQIKSDRVARTNHGIWLPDAGYQKDSPNILLKMRRISSESRLLIANHILDTVKSPQELMPLMAYEWIDNPQLTTLRTPVDVIQTRTTEQLMLDPGKRNMFVRNVDGIFDFNQKTANDKNSQVLVGILDY